MEQWTGGNEAWTWTSESGLRAYQTNQITYNGVLLLFPGIEKSCESYTHSKFAHLGG